jgi:hypothetical protein
MKAVRSACSQVVWTHFWYDYHMRVKIICCEISGLIMKSKYCFYLDIILLSYAHSGFL